MLRICAELAFKCDVNWELYVGLSVRVPNKRRKWIRIWILWIPLTDWNKHQHFVRSMPSTTLYLYYLFIDAFGSNLLSILIHCICWSPEPFLWSMIYTVRPVSQKISIPIFRFKISMGTALTEPTERPTDVRARNLLGVCCCCCWNIRIGLVAPHKCVKQSEPND